MSARDDFNKLNRYGTNALFIAIEKNKIEEVADMIYSGADINFRTMSRGTVSSLTSRVPYAAESTPLHAACLQGAAGIVKLLIENDAEVNARNAEGQTPLDYATLSLTSHESQEGRKGSSMFTSQRVTNGELEKAMKYEETIVALLDAGAQPGVFALPERFAEHVKARQLARPAVRFQPPSF